jgi:hypothetical protein
VHVTQRGNGFLDDLVLDGERQVDRLRKNRMLRSEWYDGSCHVFVLDVPWGTFLSLLRGFAEAAFASPPAAPSLRVTPYLQNGVRITSSSR